MNGFCAGSTQKGRAPFDYSKLFIFFKFHFEYIKISQLGKIKNNSYCVGGR